MSYNIIWSPKSKDELKKLNTDLAKRIIKKVNELELAPYHFIEKITDIAGWKLRVGDYRIILDIQEKEKKIEILKIGHRKKIYKSL